MLHALIFVVKIFTACGRQIKLSKEVINIDLVLWKIVGRELSSLKTKIGGKSHDENKEDSLPIGFDRKFVKDIALCVVDF